MQVKRFKFKDTEIVGVDPQRAGEEIAALGKTTPKRLVDYARKEVDSEVHKAFTWDDHQAAYRFRLNEARELLTNLVVVEQVASPLYPAPVSVSIQAFEKVIDNGVEVYQITAVTAEELEASRALPEAKRSKGGPDAKLILRRLADQISEAKMLYLSNRGELQGLLPQDFENHLLAAQDELLAAQKVPEAKV